MKSAIILGLLGGLLLQVKPEKASVNISSPSEIQLLYIQTPQSRVEILSGDLEFIKVYDEQGILTLTAFKDGHVEVKDQSKIDTAAKEFWELMAKYELTICPLNKKEEDSK